MERASSSAWTGPPDDRRAYLVPDRTAFLHGGLGVVYKASATSARDWLAEGKFVAVKCFNPDVPAARFRKLQERSALLRQVIHPRLARQVEVFVGPPFLEQDADSDEDVAERYSVHEWIEGESLAVRCTSASPESILGWGREAAEGLDALHVHRAGPFAHRDVHPRNVIITPDEHAVLIDFDTIFVEGPSGTLTSVLLQGTRFSPAERSEGIEGAQRDDRWSLARTVLYSLAGDPGSELRLDDACEAAERSLAGHAANPYGVVQQLRAVIEGRDTKSAVAIFDGIDRARQHRRVLPRPLYRARRHAPGRLSLAAALVIAVLLAGSIVGFQLERSPAFAADSYKVSNHAPGWTFRQHFQVVHGLLKDTVSLIDGLSYPRHIAYRVVLPLQQVGQSGVLNSTSGLGNFEQLLPSGATETASTHPEDRIYVVDADVTHKHPYVFVITMSLLPGLATSPGQAKIYGLLQQQDLQVLEATGYNLAPSHRIASKTPTTATTTSTTTTTTTTSTSTTTTSTTTSTIASHPVVLADAVGVHARQLSPTAALVSWSVTRGRATSGFDATIIGSSRKCTSLAGQDECEVTGLKADVPYEVCVNPTGRLQEPAACSTIMLLEANPTLTWSMTGGPQDANGSISFRDVSCTSPSSCVGIGSTYDAGALVPFAAQWNGRSWHLLSAPPGSSDPSGISCVTARWCMVVEGAGGNDSLIWNGSTWRAGHVPVPAGTNGSIVNVQCTSTTWCIGVGSYLVPDAEANTALAEVWNGTGWAIMPSPGLPGKSVTLSGITCTSRGECIAVGERQPAGDGNSGNVTSYFVQRLSKGSWKVMSTPTSQGYGTLESISCVSPNSCVAVGNTYAGDTDEPSALLWDGTRWSPDAVMNPSGGGILEGVACVPGGRCTAVGTIDLSGVTRNVIVVEHGVHWTVAKTSNHGAIDDALAAISCPSATSCVAVGSFGDGPTGSMSLYGH
jgi:serine/threonine protein kinase